MFTLQTKNAIVISPSCERRPTAQCRESSTEFFIVRVSRPMPASLHDDDTTTCMGLAQVQKPQRVAGDLVPHRGLVLPECRRLGIRAGSRVHHDSLMAQHALDAEHVIAVAYGQAGFHLVSAHDGGDTAR